MAGDRRYRHLHGTATRRFVEHPLRNFERSVILLLLETTAKHGSRAFADHANDQRRAPVPRMPAISDNAAFGNMGVPLSVCTTHIADTPRSVDARRSTTSDWRWRARQPDMWPARSQRFNCMGVSVAGTPAIAAPRASYAVDFSQLMKNAELLPPAAADCAAGKIDEASRRRESGTKTTTCPRKRGSSRPSDNRRSSRSYKYSVRPHATPKPSSSRPAGGRAKTQLGRTARREC
jgi:hypothetical protein